MTLRHDRSSRGILRAGLVCLAILSFLCLTARAGEPRTWSDISGKFSREAEFLKLEDGQVHLRISSGKETKIPLKELSKKDRDWVRANAPAVAAANAAAVAAAAAAAAPATPAGSRIVLRSYKAIVDDAVFLSEALKQQALAGAIPGLFVALTGGKPLDGFDITKPIVITGHIDARGELAGTLVAVPVQGKERFQKTLDAVFPPKTTPAGRGHEIAMLGTTIYAKPGAGYFLLSDDPHLVHNAAADPPAPVVVADISMESFTSAIPEEIRQESLGKIDAAIATIAVVEGDATRQEAVQIIRDTARSLVSDIDRVTLDASLDPTTKALSVALGVKARAETPMAGVFASYGVLHPTFAGPEGEAAVGWAGLSLPASRLVRDAIQVLYGDEIGKVRETLEKHRGQPGFEKAEATVKRMSEEIGRLAAVAHYEQELSFRVDGSSDVQIVSRVAYTGGKNYVAAWHDLVALALPRDAIIKDADGILSAKMPAAQMATIGVSAKHPLRAWGTDKAMIFAFGCADVAPMKAMMGRSAGSSGLSPLSARIDLAKLWPVMAASNPATATMSNVVGQFGMLRADVSPLSEGIELRINADAGVVRLLGALGAAAAQAQGAGGRFNFTIPIGTPGLPAPSRPGSPPAGLLPQSIQGFPLPPVAPPQAPAS